MKYLNNKFINLALEQAQHACKLNEVPVGAVITNNDTVISLAHNLNINNHDPTAHAEILAIRKAAKILNSSYLTDCCIYVTLEPCPMCAQAISFARIKRLYFGAYDVKSGGVENGPRIFHSTSCHHRPEIFGGIQEEKSKKILQEFFAKKRELT